MKNLLLSTVLVLAPALVLAQTATQKPPASAKKAKTSVDRAAAKAATAKATKAAKARADQKTVVAKAETTPRSTALKTAAGLAAAGTVAAGVASAGALSSQELAIAENVHIGNIPCELGASVRVMPDTQSPGHFHIDGKGFKYHMAPVATSTGTVRLEDQKAGAVWLQIANKSMLMDQKRGQRLADECMSPAQVAVAESIKKNPPPSVLDAHPNTAQ